MYHIINNDLREYDTVLIATEKYDDYIKVPVENIADRFALFIRQHGLVSREKITGRKPAMKSAKELFSEFR
ncbi:TPA: hypothetical protein I7702_16800 [Vibrio vulnificus]|nr:hypothetical protein [Vibrio vulnificus]HAS8460819.1 hypothetical protein [Vibrio vulnificus]